MNEPVQGLIVRGRFRIVRSVGRGGHGHVHEAEDVLSGSRVALKYIKAGAWPAASKEFMAELEAVKGFTHPNVSAFLELIHEQDGSAWVVSEWCQGDPLTEWIRKGKSSSEPIGRAVTVALEIAKALRAAHEHGLAHGALRPSNVFVVDAPVPTVKITDFTAGVIDRHADNPEPLNTLSHSFVTLPYCSPELLQEQHRVDPRADIYSLAALLYGLIVGGVPFRAKNLAPLVAEILSNTPIRLSNVRTDVPIELAMAIERAMAKDPHHRYATMSEFTNAIASHRDVLAEPAWARASAVPEVSELHPERRSGPHEFRDSEVGSAIIAVSSLGGFSPRDTWPKVLVCAFVLGLIAIVYTMFR